MMREVRTKKTKTVCTYCGVGCSFDIWTKEGEARHILKVEPSAGRGQRHLHLRQRQVRLGLRQQPRSPHPSAHPRRRHLPRSQLGRSAYADRRAVLRDQAGQRPRLTRLHLSSKTTNEESYLMQKLARAVVGTNNVDNCSRYCQSPATQGLFRTVGYGGDSGSIKDIGKAGLRPHHRQQHRRKPSGTRDPRQASPQAARQKLIVADIREHEMARPSRHLLPPNRQAPT